MLDAKYHRPTGQKDTHSFLRQRYVADKVFNPNKRFSSCPSFPDKPLAWFCAAVHDWIACSQKISCQNPFAPSSISLRTYVYIFMCVCLCVNLTTYATLLQDYVASAIAVQQSSQKQEKCIPNTNRRRDTFQVMEDAPYDGLASTSDFIPFLPFPSPGKVLWNTHLARQYPRVEGIWRCEGEHPPAMSLMRTLLSYRCIHYHPFFKVGHHMHVFMFRFDAISSAFVDSRHINVFFFFFFF